MLPFAERFAAAGFSVLVFDYRYFGVSNGTPRQQLNINDQLDDWTAAIAFARTLAVVDPSRIALWGSSFSGGHVIAAAVRDGHVRAVSSQCPMMDGLAALKNVIAYAGLGYVLRLTGIGILDQVCTWTGRPRKRLPIVGPPGSLAAMTTPDAEPGYLAIAPPDFVNAVCANIALSVGLYRPGLLADRLPCPVLIQICTRDSVAPADAAEAAAARAGDLTTVKRYPIGHFDLYLGEDFNRSVSDQIEFFEQHLTPN